jgi:DDE superfamily endonuclease
MRGTKNSKERITIGLLCNSTGECMEKLCVIGKAAKPHCFRNWAADRTVHYYNNSTAWMKDTITVLEATSHLLWPATQCPLACAVQATLPTIVT